MPSPPSTKKANAGPGYYDLIKEAVIALKERSGSSRHAIDKFVAAKKGSNYSKSRLNIALKRGVESGKLVPVKGSFKLATDEKKVAKKPVAKLVAKKASPAKKPASKPVKKRVLSKTGTKKVALKKSPKTAKKLTTKKVAKGVKKVSSKKPKTTKKKVVKKSAAKKSSKAASS
ncbi:histone h1 [Plasmopara halstedii]|uniref:Histone h1 n=1 Tax=Plasmopara halstedii TaxID=4781 RepID=A0A0P1B5Z4_PLAHL|nr:histone h1 [Plasmopara halstedii]CEG49629.1 histone h1 [Plasmopara halstedii]|eukprot:XP_024585998.1 histone h1 [Plasmopara halstedii]